MIKEGESAPAWKGLDQDGKPVSSTDYGDMWLLLYFYPKDDTPGCTAEACGFRDSYAALSHRISIVGVSGDSAESHKSFVDKYQLPFTLVADPDREIIKTFGADGLLLPKRVTFLIDPANLVRKIYQCFDTANHAAEVGKDLEALGA